MIILEKKTDFWRELTFSDAGVCKENIGIIFFVVFLNEDWPSESIYCLYIVA